MTVMYCLGRKKENRFRFGKGEYEMTIAEMMEKMIVLCDGSLHDINHMIGVWTYARTIGQLEKLDQETQYILEAAAITHDIACPLCREKYGSTNGKHQEREGEVLVRAFLADKGFTTVECYGGLDEVHVPEGSVVLLECLANLLSDECYDEQAGWQDAHVAADRIERGVEALAAQCDQLIVVTNDVGSDGVDYPHPTDEYVRALGALNCRIAAKADVVLDFAAGIPTVVKGQSEGSQVSR
jgi:adenosyl cobinamide kinase/adenosyl cobinamide phosphate guanylyltransferase